MEVEVEAETDDDEEVVHGKEEGGVRPESVSNAMKVLEVHEDMLERGGETGCETRYALDVLTMNANQLRRATMTQ